MAEMNFYEKLLYNLPDLIKALQETGIMMGIAMIFCLVIGLPVGVSLYMSNPKIKDSKRINYWILNLFITIVRSFPYLLFVIALIPVIRFIMGSSFGPVPASVPLSIVSIAIFARLVEQVLLDVPEEIYLLADSLGTSRWQFIRSFLLVEARSGLVLAYTTTTVSMVSYSTVMGIVGGGGIGDFAIRFGYQRYEWGLMYFAVVIMIISVFIIQMLGNLIAQKLDKRK